MSEASYSPTEEAGWLLERRCRSLGLGKRVGEVGMVGGKQELTRGWRTEVLRGVGRRE